MSEYMSVPIEDPEKAHLINANGEPASEIHSPPPQYEERRKHHRCRWAHRPWGRFWWGRHRCDRCDYENDDDDDDYDADNVDKKPHRHPRRRCRRFVSFLFHLFVIWIVVHVIVHAVHHAHRQLRHHRGHHGHHGHGHYGQYGYGEEMDQFYFPEDNYYESQGYDYDRQDLDQFGIDDKYRYPDYTCDEQEEFDMYDQFGELDFPEDEYQDYDLDEFNLPEANTAEFWRNVFGSGRHPHHPRHPRHPHHPRHPRHPCPPRHPPHRPPGPPPACNPDSLEPWDGPSNFGFSPDNFSAFILRQEGSSDHGEIFLYQSADVEDVTVSVNILVADEKLSNEIEVFATGEVEKGIYILTVRTPRQRLGPECLKLSVEVAFPKSIETFKTFIRAANLDIKAKSLSKIKFENAFFHTLNGSISVKELRVTEGKLGAIHGRVSGKVIVSEKVEIGSVKGIVDVEVEPETIDETVEIKARVVSGHVHLKVPADSFSGPFKVATFVGKAVVTAEDEDSLVIEKRKPNFVVGYYNESDTGNKIVVEGIHSLLNLTFT